MLGLVKPLRRGESKFMKKPNKKTKTVKKLSRNDLKKISGGATSTKPSSRKPSSSRNKSGGGVKPVGMGWIMSDV